MRPELAIALELERNSRIAMLCGMTIEMRLAAGEKLLAALRVQLDAPEMAELGDVLTADIDSVTRYLELLTKHRA